ncbi:acetylxylan esterase [Verrucomicrobium sp. GAS474]|uniref:acetylxylan esterase n=1 Tax=Verrucomicrobium sp. GAS474 TaxID=1882831 RepID=UPI0012FF8AFC|nr:acetylxylan esterase [Verrucomicrobium sp. GAS474]
MGLFTRLASLLFFVSPLFAADPVLTVLPDHPTGVYALGEKVTWTVDVKSGERAGFNAVAYAVRKDGADKVAEGTVDLSAGPATITASRDEPGVLLAIFPNPDKTKPQALGVGGAVYAPEKIGPSLPAPDDFDAFWDAKLKDLAAVPINPVVEKGSLDGVKNTEGLDYYKVTLDNINGTHVQGHLARPTAGEKFPAMLMVQFAGVYPLDKAQLLAQARPGWLVLNIQAHDAPADGTVAFFEELKNGALKNYIYQGSDDRETSYFLRMLLGDVRAAEYLASRPDWDGKTLVVTGTSQGGLQSFAAAALDPKITHLMTLVPAGCDVYGPLATPARAFGWPYWLSNWGPRDRDPEKVKKTAGYFDPVYFAHRITCPALVAPGLIDDTARPAGILAAFNALQGPKELVLLPLADHHGTGGSQGAYFTRFNAWKSAIQRGEPLPLPAH